MTYREVSGPTNGTINSLRTAIATTNEPDLVLLNDWHVVGNSAELKPGTLFSTRLMGQDLVVWRGENHTVHVWQDRCPHRSVQLSNGKVVNNTLVCAYHGMVYDTEGKCIKIPAHPDYIPPQQACVPTYAVQEHYGLVFVCLGEQPDAIPGFPEWDDRTYLNVLSGPHYCQTGGYRAIENFLDVAHFPFLHGGILGDSEMTALPDYTVRVNQTGVHLDNVRVWQPDPMGTGQGDFVTYDYAAVRPLTAYLRKNNSAGERLAILYCVTPVSEEACIGWMLVAVNFMDASQTQEVLAFQDKIFAQDLKNLESHNPKQLPLNPRAEFHVPCDRGSLAYRQWLKQLGVTYGVIL